MLAAVLAGWAVVLLVCSGVTGIRTTVTATEEASAVVRCDVVIAGGSTASLAAAVTAATVRPTARVCLTDPTDWLGGQLTSSAVSAIDFGANKLPAYQSKSFRALMTALGAPRNPGACWVSEMCYEPLQLVQKWLNPTLSASWKTLV